MNWKVISASGEIMGATGVLVSSLYAARTVLTGRHPLDSFMCRVFCVILLFVVSAGISKADEINYKTGSELLAPFKKELKQALLAGMHNGVDAAIATCRLRAPEIANSLSTDGVRLGRTSDRLRNPENIGPDWVKPILETYLHNPSNRSPKNLTLRNSLSGYVEPIIIQPLCTACHGSSVASETRIKLKALYPEDKAIGYEVGDLRGVFWVEYKN
ncbi:MAG: c-type heme family protein [Gammaproteobacteria bacterium]